LKFSYILVYFAVINLIGCILNIADKSRAKRQAWRIKESTLWITAALGGATLSFITMKAIRHKTKHKSFMIIMPILAGVQISALIFIYIKYFMGG